MEEELASYILYGIKHGYDRCVYCETDDTPLFRITEEEFCGVITSFTACNACGIRRNRNNVVLCKSCGFLPRMCNRKRVCRLCTL